MRLQKVLILAVISGSFIFTACKCERKGEYAVDNTAATTGAATANTESTSDGNTSQLDENGNFIYDTGMPTEITLPGDIKMNVGEFSSENKLFGMLNSADFTVSEDKTKGWVTLDRVYFETGKSELTAESKNQLNNIVSLLKAFPEAEIKIGGYTDNTGSAETNLAVSAERAQKIADMMTTDGIDASRIDNEGYGASHFVCEANDTDECRAQNRRVDIRITKK